MVTSTEGSSRQRRRRGRLAVAVTAVTAALALVAGCSSSGGSGSQSPAPAAPASGQAATGATGGGGSSLVAAAKAEIAQHSGPLTFTDPGPAVDAAKVKSKKIFLVAHDLLAGTLVSVSEGVKAAAQALGMDVEIFDGQGKVSTIQQGLQNAIKSGVGAILLDGVTPTLVPTTLKKAADAGIPIVAISLGVNLTNPSVYGVAGPDTSVVGRLQADKAIVESNGKVDGGAIIFDNPSSRDVINGIEKVFSNCDACKISAKNDIEPSHWSSDVPSTVASMIRADSSLNFIFTTDDTMGQFAVSGVRNANAQGKVHVLGAYGSGKGPLGLVADGSIYLADPGYPTQWAGWGAVDQALRGMLGMKPGNDVTPVRFFDSSVLKSLKVDDPVSLYGDAYQAGYKKVWGLSD